jgi:hypothetical protein
MFSTKSFVKKKKEFIENIFCYLALTKKMTSGVKWNSAKSHGFRLYRMDSSCTGQILACFARFWQSDTKIREFSVVELGYQQTPVPSGGRFPQTCMQ